MIALLILSAWYRFQVDTVSAAGTGIALDLNHRPHVFYYSNSVLYHDFWTGSGWRKEIVDSAASYHNGGPAVVIDDRGWIHVAFFGKNERLRYALYDQTWQVEAVDTSYRTGDYCDIALDQNNRPRIAYHRSTGTFSGYLRYASKTTAWQIYEHSSEYGGYHASLELDSLNYPHISDCTDWSTGDLRYIYYDGQAWRYEKPVTANAAGFNSLALDAQDRPQISLYWVGGGNYDLRFTEKNTGVWRLHVVDHGLQLNKRGWDNKMVIDNGNTLHIAYHCHNENLLKYARGREASWTTEVVDTIGGWTASTAIAIDGSDIFVSYYDENTTDVWAASTRNFVGIEEASDARCTMRDAGLRILQNPTTRAKGIRLLAACHTPRARLQIFDVAGKLVRSLVLNPMPSALCSVVLPAGVYFVRLEADRAPRSGRSPVITKKVVVVQ